MKERSTTHSDSQRAITAEEYGVIERKLREILLALPEKADLFPTIRRSDANARATEFRRRRRVASVSGVSLHSYRHSWAQRAKTCGYPQRFAQEALGHSS